MSGDPVVSLDGVTVDFDASGGLLDDLLGRGDSLTAVDDVSLDIGENDVVTLVGESGCGKSTLGEAAAGLQRPTDGRVTFRGRDVWEAYDSRNEPFGEIRRNLQLIHQDPGSSLNPNRTVMGTLGVPFREWRDDLSRSERRGRVLGLLEKVGLTPASDYASRYPHQLSGGEKQRVALIRALLMNPDLIVADEAVSALDVSLRVEMMDLMLELQEMFGTSYLFIAHDLSNARYLAEKAGGRIGVMYLGRLVELGPAEEVVEDPSHPYTQVLRWATPSLSLEAEANDGPPVRQIDVPDPVDPPSGCRFHTRCPKARDVCTRDVPVEYTVDDESHWATCFRRDAAHPYWGSQPLEDEAAAPLEEERGPPGR